MSLRRTPCLVLLGLLLVPARPAAADKLDKDSQKWLDSVASLILPEEEKTFRGLKEKADREEFQKIFWARRNPQGPAAAENPFKAGFETARAAADQRFKVPGTAGSLTDCGRLFILLGEPDEVKQEPFGESPGARRPEVWTYKSRPGITFTGGQIQVALDPSCASRVSDQIRRLAEARIVSPNIGYRTGPDGRLVKLADQLPKPTPAQALLEQPRQDFALTSEPKLVIRGRDGTYVGGLVRGTTEGLSPEEHEGKKTLPVVVAARALDDAGKMAAATELEVTTEVSGDGSFLGSYGLTLKPGKYTLRTGALDKKTGKGSAVSVPIEVPDFGGAETSIADLVIVADVVERTAQDPHDPLAAFFMGVAQLVPRFGNVFRQSEAIQGLDWVYNPQVDPATGKASLAARFAILKGGRTLTQTAEDQVFEEAVSTPGVGPIPLAKFEPGKYVLQLSVTDRVAKKDYTKQAPFEVVP